MSISYVEKEQAHPVARAFYEKIESAFDMELNLVKIFGHVPEIGAAYADVLLAILKDGELPWATKELLILKAAHRNECRYCVVQHENVIKNLGVSDEKVADIGGARYKNSPHFSDAEKALLDLTVYIGINANHVPEELWDRLREHFTEAQIVEAAFTITTYIGLSKFGVAMKVELEPVFTEINPILEVNPEP